MTDEELAEIEARAVRATAGPWITHGYGSGDSYVRVTQPDGWPDDPVCDVGRNTNNREQDAAFIAYARTDVPALVAEVRRLQKALRDASSALLDPCARDIEERWNAGLDVIEAAYRKGLEKKEP